MIATPTVILPYEPQYSGHREAEHRRRLTKEWLRQREREVEQQSPSIVPERAPDDEKA